MVASTFSDSINFIGSSSAVHLSLPNVFGNLERYFSPIKSTDKTPLSSVYPAYFYESDFGRLNSLVNWICDKQDANLNTSPSNVTGFGGLSSICSAVKQSFVDHNYLDDFGSEKTPFKAKPPRGILKPPGLSLPSRAHLSIRFAEEKDYLIHEIKSRYELFIEEQESVLEELIAQEMIQDDDIIQSEALISSHVQSDLSRLTSKHVLHFGGSLETRFSSLSPKSIQGQHSSSESKESMGFGKPSVAYASPAPTGSLGFSMNTLLAITEEDDSLESIEEKDESIEDKSSLYSLM